MGPTSTLLHPFANMTTLPLLLIAVSLYSIQLTRALADPNHGVMLEAANFRLESRLRLIPADLSSMDEDIRVSEFYSNEQKRARINIVNGINVGGELRFATQSEFYYESSAGDRGNLLKLTQNHHDGRTACNLWDRAEFFKDLFGSGSHSIRELGNLDWLYSGQYSQIPGHFVGPARILLLIKQNMDRMREVGGRNSSIEIRNHQTRKYELELDLNYNNEAAKSATKFVLFFGHSSVHWPNAEFPLELWITFPSEGELVIEFSLLEPIFANDFMEPEDGIDMFAVPVGLSCSQNLQPAGKNSTSVKSQRVFSFRADLYQHSFKMETKYLFSPFVAYDGHVRAFRYEYLQRDATSSFGLKRHSNYVTIHDLKRNLKFNSVQQVYVPDSGLHESTSVESSSKPIDLRIGSYTSPASCLAASIIMGGNKTNPFEPIVPFRSLVQMGRGSVRGLQVSILEMESDELPASLFPRVNYQNGAGEIKSGFTPHSRAGSGSNYSLVYYFARSSNGSEFDREIVTEQLTLGPLVRVDVVFDGDLLYRAEIHEFLWQLAPSPSGDRADELFELQTKCLSEDKRRQLSANLDLELRLEMQNEDFATKSALENPTTRNKALIRALGGSPVAKIYPSQLWELKSRLRVAPDNRSFLISLVAKLNDAQPGVYRAVSMGSGLIVSDRIERLRATTFDACFWSAIRRQVGVKNRVLFSFCLNSCVVDDSPEESADNPLGLQSSGFFMRDGLPCEVLKLDAIETKSADEGTWAKVYKGLNGKLLELPLVGSGYDDAKFISGQVRRVRLNGDEWLRSAASNESTKLDASSDSLLVFDNMSFLAAGDGQVTKTIEPRTFPALKGNSPDRTMNFAACYARCVADLSCRSFSLCITGQQVECINSQVDLRNETSLKQVQVATQSMRAGDRIDLQIDTDLGAQRFSLKSDRRCKLYSKRALEMFQVLDNWIRVRVNGKNLIKVSSEEQCAELCLSRSIKFFKRVASMKLNLLRDEGQGETVDERLHEQYMESMRYFCGKFRYFPLATASVADEETANKLNQLGLSEAPAICSLVRPQPKTRDEAKTTKAAEPSEPVVMVELRMRAFDLIYTMLYSRTHNVQLFPGAVHARIGDKLIMNTQVVSKEKPSVENCARSCFLQATGLKPGCKSFTFVEDRSELAESAKVTNFCLFNTVSLAEARQSENPSVLVAEETGPESGSDFVYWHFDPIDDYSLDSAIWTRLYSLDDIEQRHQFTFGAFATILITIFSIVSGISLGALVGLRYLRARIDRRASIISQSQSILQNIVEVEEQNQSGGSIELDANVNELPDMPSVQ